MNELILKRFESPTTRTFAKRQVRDRQSRRLTIGKGLTIRDGNGPSMSAPAGTAFVKSSM